MDRNCYDEDRGFIPANATCPPTPCARACTTRRCHEIGEDYGPDPFTVDLERATLENPYFRRTLWTGDHLQLTVMCIPPRGEIGLERHCHLDQFLRLEQGQGRVTMGPSQSCPELCRTVHAGHAVFIPAGTWHNLVNTGDEPIKLYSIYSPVQHPAGTIHCTKADSDAAE